MNLDAISLDDCLLNYEVNSQVAIINDGHIIKFEDEESIPLYMIYYLNNN